MPIVHLVANPSDLKQITMSVFGRMNPSQDKKEIILMLFQLLSRNNGKPVDNSLKSSIPS